MAILLSLCVSLVGSIVGVGVALAPAASAITTAPPFLLSFGSLGSGNGQMNGPIGIAVGPSGTLYVLERSGHRVQKFDSSGNFIGAWGSVGAAEGQFGFVSGIAVDAAENVYVSEGFNGQTTGHRIQKFTSSGTFLMSFGSFGTGDGQLSGPIEVAIDGSGNVIVAETETDRIQKFDSSGAFLTKWGTFGTGSGQLSNPWGVAVGSDGSVYVSENSGHRVQKFNGQGVSLLTWGSQGTAPGQFSYPAGIGIDSANRVYVTDSINDRVQIFDSVGTPIVAWGTPGTGNGQFVNPSDVAVDPSGNVYVVDFSANRVQKFGPVVVVADVALTVTKAGTGAGNVASTPAGIDCGATCSTTVAPGSQFTLTATAAPGSVFAGWSGACSGLQTCAVTMDAAKTVTATFDVFVDGPSWVVNTTDDVNDGACTLAHCSLREALNRSNSNPGTDTISFAIPGAGVRTIRPLTDLPFVTGAVVLDATTQPGYSGVPLVELDGSLVTAGNRIGLWVFAGSSTIKGFIINRWGNRGLLIESPNNTVVANYIGTTADGSAKAADFSFNAIEIRNGANNVVGGTSPADRNVIVGGLTISFAAATGNIVKGNYIGTDVTGTVNVGSRLGLWITGGSNNVIGGPEAGAGNVISGSSSGNGVEINNGGTGVASGNVVQGNLIGTTASGEAPLGNRAAGVVLFVGNNTVGGTAPGAGNVIAANGGDGVRVQGDGAIVQGNWIGLTRSGAPMANTGDGVVLIGGTALNSLVGGTTAGAGNTIANNGGAGVAVLNGTGHRVLGNSISDNVGIGIDIGPGARDGVTANDAGDADTGANNRQNFPVLSAATAGAPGAIVGRVDSPAGTYRVEVFKVSQCDPSGNGEGTTFLGSTSTAANVDFSVAAAVAVGDLVTATATDAGGNTSEFSVCTPVTAGSTTSALNLTSSNNPSAHGESVTFTASVTASATPTGSVTFTDGATTLGTVALVAGVAHFTTTTLTIGSHPITATYGGNPSVSGSTDSLTQVVTAAVAACSPPNQVRMVTAPQNMVNNQLVSASCIFVMPEQTGVVLTAPLAIDSSVRSAVYGTVLPVGSVLSSWIAHTDVPSNVASGSYSGSFDLPPGQHVVGTIWTSPKLAASDAIVGSLASTFDPDPSMTWRQMDGAEGSVSVDYNPTTDVETVKFARFDTFLAIDEVRVLTGTVPQPNVTVIKDTVGGEGSFTFSLSGQPDRTISTVTGTGTASWSAVASGPVTLTELAQPTWSITGASCTRNGVTYPATRITGGLSLTIHPGSDITCRVTNRLNPPATLSVTRAGAGSGTVTSASPSINCGTTCTATVADGTEETLTATPNPGSTFVGWSGGCTGAGACVVSVHGTTSVTATFDIALPTCAAPDQLLVVAAPQDLRDDKLVSNSCMFLMAEQSGVTLTVPMSIDMSPLPGVGTTLPVGSVVSSRIAHSDVPAGIGENTSHTYEADLTLAPGEQVIGLIWTGGKLIGSDAAVGLDLPTRYDASGVLRQFETDVVGDTASVTPSPSGDIVHLHFATSTAMDEVRILTGTVPMPKVNLVKHAAGGDGSFAFTLTGSAPQTITTANGTGVTTINPTGVGAVSLTEAAQTGWTLMSASCERNGSAYPATTVVGGVTFNLTYGADVTCTFQNENWATIEVEKQTLPDGDPTGFVFSGAASGTLHDGEVLTVRVPAGTHTVSEAMPANYWLPSSILCNDSDSVGNTSTASATFVVGVGETVRCVFTNRGYGRVRVEKRSIPAGGTDFGFIETVGTNPPNPVYLINDGQFLGGYGAAGITRIFTETPKAGWRLVSIDCHGNPRAVVNGPSVTFSPAVGDDIVCTYTNEKLGRIRVVKQTLPDGHAQKFGFTGAVTAQLGDGESSELEVAAGTHVVTETPLTGWRVVPSTGIACSDANSTWDIVARTATYRIEPGETVTCTFTNEALADVSVEKRQRIDGITALTNAAVAAQPGDTFTYEMTAGNAGPGSAAGVVVTDTIDRRFVLLTSPGCTATPVRPQVVTCSAGTLASGATRTFTLSLELAYPDVCTRTGTRGNDTFNGTAGNDTLCGAGGGDTISGLGGDDTIWGDMPNGIDLSDVTNQAGVSTTSVEFDTTNNTSALVRATITQSDIRDFLHGNGGEDTIHGQAGDDLLWGESDDDTMRGNDGLDTINGDDGDDTMFGNAGNDLMNGDAGDDSLFGNAGTDTMSGGPGADALSGNEDDDIMSGGDSDDNMLGNDGNDLMNGDAGNDSIVGDVGDDRMNGGGGVDTMRGNDGADTMNGDAGNDTMSGDDGLDRMNGGGDADIMFGNDGVDTMNGDAGDDIMRGNDGDDTMNGDAGDDTIFGNAGNDLMKGDAGDDSLFGNAGTDTMSGGLGADALSGNEDGDIMNGDAGNDSMFGNDGGDTMNGGGGNDKLVGLEGDDWVYGDSGDDEVYGSEGVDHLFGDDGQDVVGGGTEGDFAYGGAGDDWVHGDDGMDWVDGDADDDLVSGDGGDDTVIGGFGNDFVSGDSGKDVLTGGPGRDRLTGGSENDRLIGGEDDDGTTTGNCNANSANLFSVAGHFVVSADRGSAVLSPSQRYGGLHGEGGADVIFGGTGCDDIFGGDGGDELHGDAGNDRIAGDSSYSVDDTFGGNDFLGGDAGDDLLLGQIGVDDLVGGPGSDRLHGGSGPDTLQGNGGGNDRLKAGVGGGTCILGDVYDRSCTNINTNTTIADTEFRWGSPAI